MPVRNAEGDSDLRHFHRILQQTQQEELKLLADAQGDVRRRIEEAFSGVELRLSRLRMRGTRRLAAELRTRLQADVEDAAEGLLAGRPEDRELRATVLALRHDLEDIMERIRAEPVSPRRATRRVKEETATRRSAAPGRDNRGQINRP